MMKAPRLAELLSIVKAEKDEANEVTYHYDSPTPSILDEKDAPQYVKALNFACHKPDIKTSPLPVLAMRGKSLYCLPGRSAARETSILTVSLANFDMIRSTTKSEEKPAETG
ncbi:hypothetical protein QLG07_05185 [Erwinia sp. V90_4]|uniref:hypothetical protein n=1 Tax=Erwinia sp. V90_4 TaxID=3044239 RepID=UPI00249E725B|nr:hypothetical protein [Erwinia sp. V90_4]MDI3438838.1 hypothetical protein [Erwinia sp. V90_4]